MMKRAAIYCRVSTDSQEREGTSLDTQMAACQVKAKELGYEAPGDFIFKETWTGADTDRPKLNELRDLIKQRLVDAVVCYSTDRLARNAIHIAIIAEECDKRNIELVFVTEPLDNSPEGQLIRYVKGYAAQIEHEKIRERTVRGKLEKCRQGKLATGGRRLFGYNTVDGRRVINPAEAEIVKKIYYWFSHEEYTLYRAMAELNQMAIPSPRGSRWSEFTILRLLMNPAYCGEAYAFRYKAVEPQSRRVPVSGYRKTKCILRDKEEWIKIEGTPPVVTPTVWRLAQEQLHMNKSYARRNRKHLYLLASGRLRCGICGRSMCGTYKKIKGGYKYVYRCVSNIRAKYYGHCLQPGIASGRIEPLVWGEITRVLKNPSLVIAELNKHGNGETQVALEAEQILVENRIKQSIDEEKRYIRLYGQGRIEEQLLLPEMDRVKRERGQLDAKLAEIKEQQRSLQDKKEQLERVSGIVSELASKLDNADYELKQLAIEALDVKATIYPNGSININGSIPSEAQLSCAKS
ncbi:recombinase family protein [Chloroflexota bacterium]